jgi:hypothetical protein
MPRGSDVAQTVQLLAEITLMQEAAMYRTVQLLAEMPLAETSSNRAVVMMPRIMGQDGSLGTSTVLAYSEE